MAEAAKFLERSGTVVGVEPEKNISKNPNKPFLVAGFTIEEAEENKGKVYYNYLNFNCTGKMLSQVPNIGDEVRVEFIIKGSKVEKDGLVMSFTKLKPYKIETTKFAPRGKQPAPVRQADREFLDNNQPEDESSELPF